MNSKKPDALVVLAIIFGLGILISTLRHSIDEPLSGQVYAGGAVVTASH